MKAILKEKLTIDRPIVFLCGPYYDGKNDHDRRALVRSYIRKELGGKALPLIIDDFLSEENLKGFTLKLPLLEEILARISKKTFIFLDTISAASEMGLFLNHAFNNKSVILLPKESDIVQKQVGVFAQNVITHNDNAHCIYYRPSITRSTVATGYTSEFYGFINDRIPSSISDYLRNDMDLERYEERWEFEKNKITGKEAYRIEIPVRQLFYIVVSIVYEKYLKVLRTPGKCDDSFFACDEILSLVHEAIQNYLIIFEGASSSFRFELVTEFSEPLINIIYHMVSFIFIYHKRSSSRGFHIVAEEENRSVVFTNGNNPRQVFGINQHDFDLLIYSKKEPEKFFIRKKLVVNRKKRELVKYSDDEFGEQIRGVHERILRNLTAIYEQHKLSYAYKEGASIKSCAMMHIGSYDFVKYDISKFFNSIDLKVLLTLFMQEFQIDKRYAALTREYLESCFVFGKLPLGLVLSPLLSDVYMKNFDYEIEDYCKPRAWVFTRYADDILVSSSQIITPDEEARFESTMNSLLDLKKLRLNYDKKVHIALDNEGKYVKYIGVSIVKGTSGNYLSVGKKYIYQVAKEIMKYIDQSKEQGMDEFVIIDTGTRQMVLGKIGFIRFIEGKRGIKRLNVRLKKYLKADQYHRIQWKLLRESKVDKK